MARTKLKTIIIYGLIQKKIHIRIKLEMRVSIKKSEIHDHMQNKKQDTGTGKSKLLVRQEKTISKFQGGSCHM